MESVSGRKQSWHNFQEIGLSPCWVDLLAKLISFILNENAEMQGLHSQ